VCNKIKLIGIKVSSQGIQPTMDRIAEILTIQPPTSKSELKSALGTVGFLRDYIPNYAKISYPLYDLLKESSRFSWGSDEKIAWEQLLHAMQEHVIKQPFLHDKNDNNIARQKMIEKKSKFLQSVNANRHATDIQVDDLVLLWKNPRLSLRT